MAREKPSYRDNLAAMAEWLHDKYGDKRRMMTITDVCEYTGHTYKCVKRVYQIPRIGITIETLARAMS